MKTVTTITPRGERIDRDFTPKKITSPPLPKHMGYIDGLRGLAIGLVVVFHVFVGKVSSGVDIFLFLGGMFLLRAQMKNVQKPDGLTFPQSLIRLQRRIVPILVVVVIISTLVALLTYSPIDYNDLLRQSSFAILYVLNWNLIKTGQDYNAATEGASVFQHLWSMSVQMQSYVLIMAVTFIVWWVVRKRGTEYKYAKFMYTSVSITTTLSFIYANYLYFSGAQSTNYYSTISRFWEIGLGALIGIILSRMVVTPVLRWAFSILGLVMILSVGVFMDGVQYFPAFPALIPIAGALMILVSGQTFGDDPISLRSNGPIIVFLNSHTMTALGRIAYALYLWHWVLLVLALNTYPDADKSSLGITVVIVSLILAWGTHRLIEVPLRQRVKPQRGNVFSPDYIRSARLRSPSIVYPLVAFLIIGLASVITVSPVVFNQSVRIRERVNDEMVASMGGKSYVYPGAGEFLYNDDPPEGVPIYPDVYVSMRDMLPTSNNDGCYTKGSGTDIVNDVTDGTGCKYGDINSDRTIYVVGGSHSEQYMEALNTIGKVEGIQIVPIIKMGCPLYQNEIWNGDPFPDCIEWSENVEKWVMDNPPTDGVFMISTRPTNASGWGPEIVPDFYKDVFSRIGGAGIPIYALRDNPWLITPEKGPYNPRRCLLDKGDNLSCGQPAINNMDSRENPAVAAYSDIPNIKNLDLSKAMIKDNWVFPVIGNTLVYRDAHHLTKQYVLTITDELKRQMSENPWTAPTNEESVSRLKLENTPVSFSDDVKVSTFSSSDGMTRRQLLDAFPGTT